MMIGLLPNELNRLFNANKKIFKSLSLPCIV